MMGQERIFLLTNFAVYNVKSDAIDRKISMSTIKAVTKSTKEGCTQLVVHVRSEFDYLMETDSRREILDALKWVWFQCHTENLPVYGVPNKLNDYHTTKKDIAAGLEVNPQETYRIESEDIYEGSKNTIKNIEVVKGKKAVQGPKVVPSVLLQNITYTDESMDSNEEISMYNKVFKTDRSDTMF